jgi:flagellar motor switch protein FliM
MNELLSKNEVDALLSDLDAPALAPDGDVSDDLPLYDFARPERVSKEQLRALQTLHATMAHNLGIELSAQLRSVTDCRLAAVEQIAYGDFVAELPSPTSVHVLAIEPLGGKAILEINPSIAFPIIDKLLGGTGSGAEIPDRPLTNIEQGLIDRVARRVLQQFSHVWRPVRALSPRVIGCESNPQLLQIAAPNEAVVVLVFEIHVGQAGGQVNLGLPYSTIDGALKTLTDYGSRFGGSTRPASAEERAALTARLGETRLEAKAILARLRISLGQFLELEPGDVLTTGRPCTAPATLLVAGREKFLVQVGAVDERRAVRVQAPRPPESRGQSKT